MIAQVPSLTKFSKNILSQSLLSTTSHGHPQWMEFTQLLVEIAQLLKGGFVTVVLGSCNDD